MVDDNVQLVTEAANVRVSTVKTMQGEGHVKVVIVECQEGGGPKKEGYTLPEEEGKFRHLAVDNWDAETTLTGG